MAVVLINEAFKKFLLQQSLEFRDKVRKKFEFLEIGYWDGGLKVKKVKGVDRSKSVFEARLDRSNRLLFTLGMEKENGEPRLLVYVWGIVGHDDISSGSRAIPANVPFLQFKSYREESIGQASLDELETSHFTQESIAQKISDDSTAQKWHFLDADNWSRIQKYRQGDFEMRLHLTPEQQEILQKPLPLLISGTAGSGKTTLSTYYLLKLPFAKDRKLFITYNKFLRKAAQRLYQGLLNYSALKDEYDIPDFFTFKEYCLSIAAHYHRQFPPQKEVTYDRFNRLISGKAGRFDIPLIWEEIRSIIKGALPQINLKLLQQIYQKLQGGSINAAQVQVLQQQFIAFSKLESLQRAANYVQKYLNTDIATFAKRLPQYLETDREHVLTLLERTLDLLTKQRALSQRQYLSFMDYEALGRKKAPLFHLDRKHIYQIFEWYQEQLEAEGLWDELDLTRETINLLSEHSPAQFMYDLVVCDEVQDLTDVQHELLFYIARSPRNLFLSGDIKQIINPSGFRWEELRQHFYHREISVPGICFLRLNFRSSGSIVELSNILLELKSRLLGSHADEQTEDWKYKGRPPIVIRDIAEAQMLESIRSTGASKTILVRSENEKQRLQMQLETELVFTIYEAKGLEFDTVLLWKFSSNLRTKDTWASILQESEKTAHQANIRHEINLLYVAITRAQRDLLIYDGPKPSRIWSSPRIKDQVYSTDDLSYIGEIWNVISTPGEWLQQGDYFFEREYYRAAMECYKNAGAEDLHLQARAHHAEKQQKYAEAARCFEQLGQTEKAAQHYETSGDYERALALWQKVQNKDAAFRCRLQLLEQSGAYEELADIYLRQKDYDKAYDMLVQGRLEVQAAEVSLKYLKKPMKAAMHLERARKYGEAATLQQKAGNLEHAAELYEKAKQYDRAERLWRRLKRPDRLEQLYRSTHNYLELVKIYEKDKNFDKAVRALKNAGIGTDPLAAEAEALFGKRRYFPALIRFYLLNDYEHIAVCFFKLRNHEKAGQYYERVGELYQAGKAYRKAGLYEKAFTSFLHSPEEEQTNYQQLKRLRYFISPDEIHRWGRQFYFKSRFAPAMVCLELVGDYLGAGLSAIETGQQDRARDLLLKGLKLGDDYLPDLAEYCLERDEIEFGGKFVVDLPGYLLPYITPAAWKRRLASLITLMDRYFEQDRDREELMTWAAQLPLHDAPVDLLRKRYYYLERAREFNEYFRMLYVLSKYDTRTFKKLVKEFKNEYAQEKWGISEVAAIKLYFLKKTAEFNRMMTQLSPTANNFLIFMVSESHDRVLTTEFIDMAKRYKYVIDELLKNKGEFAKLGHLFELGGMEVEAATYYNLDRQYSKAAELFEKTGKVNRAGDAYHRAGDHRKALEMFLLWGKNKSRIAREHECLGEYTKAAAIWRKMGKTAKAEKCLQKSQQPGLFDG